MVDPELIRSAFGDLFADQEEGQQAASQLAEAIVTLSRLMDGDGGGAVRVGYMLVQLGRRVAGVPVP